MRLFHVSEEPHITRFEPRLPKRADLDPDVGLVWAIDEARLPNFLTPRDCPRVTYHAAEQTTAADRRRFFTSTAATHALVIEHDWFDAMRRVVLYLYEFDPQDFVLQDAVAGYYVATKTQIPIAVHRIDDAMGELIRRGVELRITDHLQDIAAAVQKSSLNWSLCRMRNAKD